MVTTAEARHWVRRPDVAGRKEARTTLLERATRRRDVERDIGVFGVVVSGEVSLLESVFLD